MRAEGSGSVTRWIAGVKEGDAASVQSVWERYFADLVRMAHGRLREMHPAAGELYAEDAVLSAFHSFCLGAAAGRFPQVGDRDSLWRLLLLITSRKAVNIAKREGRQKRGANRVLREANLPGEDGDEPFFERLPGREPSPEFAAMMAEQFRLLLDRLGNASLAQVAVLKMEGFTDSEVAERLGVARRTIVRKLDVIRRIWGEEVAR